MTRVDGPTTVNAGEPAQKGAGSAGSLRLALGLGIAAIIAPVFYFLFFPIIGLAAVGAVFAIVLVFRARRAGHRGALPGTALALGVVGAIIDIVVLIAIIGAIMGPGLTRVEIRATGGATFGVEYAVGSDDYSDEWQTDGFKKFSTPGSTAEITVTPTDEGVGVTHSCTILWGGVVVAEESSDSGPVTCSYDAG